MMAKKVCCALASAAAMLLLAASARAEVYFTENFNGYADDAAVVAAGWQILDQSPVADPDWTITNPGGRLNPFGSTGQFMVTDTDAAGDDGTDTNESLVTPAIDLSSAPSVWLHFNTAMAPNDNGESRFHVDVSPDGGASWTNVFSSYSPGIGAGGPEGNADGRLFPVDLNLTSILAGAETAHVRFVNLDGNDDWFWAVDDVTVDSTPANQGGSIILLGKEAFTIGIPDTWTVESASNTNPWTTLDPCGRAAGDTPGSSKVNRLVAPFAILDSDCDPDQPEDESLITPAIDCSKVGTVYLHALSELKWNNGNPTICDIDVSLNGTTWETLFSYNSDLIPMVDDEIVFDNIVLAVPQAAGEANVQFRFRFQGSGDEWWWAVDEVMVTADGYFEEQFNYVSDAEVTAAGWQINDNSTTTNPDGIEYEADWTITNPAGRANPYASQGAFMIADSDYSSPDPGDGEVGLIDEELISPTIDLSGINEAYLHFATYIEPNDEGDSVNEVDISIDNGQSWQNVFAAVSPNHAGGWAIAGEDGNADGRTIPVSLDISGIAAGQSQVKVRFHYYDATDDWFWIVDSVRIDGYPGFKTGLVIAFPPNSTDLNFASAPGTQTPVGVAGTTTIMPNQGFENGIPNDWTVLSDTPDDQPWIATSDGGQCFRNAAGWPGANYVNRLGDDVDSDFFALLDSDCNGTDPTTEDQQLITHSMDLTNYSSAYIHVKSELKHNVGETICDIDVTRDGGATWMTLFRYGDSPTPPGPRDNEVYYDPMVVDASIAAGASDVQFRFRFRGNEWEWWWAIDDIMVTGIPGQAVSYEPPNKPSVMAPANTDPLAPVALSGSTFSDPNPGDTLARATWLIYADAEGTHLLQQHILDSNPAHLTLPPLSLLPGYTYYAAVQYEDQLGLKSEFSDTAPFAVQEFNGVLFSEDFEDAPDFGLPTGWTEENHTTPDVAGLDPNNPDSDTYLGWTVIPEATLASVYGGNRINNGGVYKGKSVYAESDQRTGNQIQYLFTPDIPINGATDLYVFFGSNYVQNQDNIAALEYNLGGSQWYPALYMLDQDDILMIDGVIDAEGTMTRVDPEAADVDGDGNGTYGEATLVRPFADMTPFISPRVNDNDLESKRLEFIRIEAADGAASVKFRFTQSATASWFWGVDDFKVISLSAGPTEPASITAIALNPQGGLNLTWEGGTGPFQVQRSSSLVNPQWVDVGAPTEANTATVPAEEAAGFFRVVNAGN